MATKTRPTWQEELADECSKRGLRSPVYNIVSDRRGGRTAWSATVTLEGQNIAARYWYDGQYLNNAKEDAAEVACTRLRNPAIISGGVRGQSGMPSRQNFGRSAGMEASEEPTPAREEEKVEPDFPEGATHVLKDSHLEQATTHTEESAAEQIAAEPPRPGDFD